MKIVCIVLQKDGLQLGEKLRELNPKIVLVFFKEHTEYILEALRIKADGYMIRPYTMEDLTWTMGNAKLLSRRQKKPAYIRTFGRFDLFINGELVIFSLYRIIYFLLSTYNNHSPHWHN